jgi:hypothetical protein
MEFASRVYLGTDGESLYLLLFKFEQHTQLEAQRRVHSAQHDMAGAA